MKPRVGWGLGRDRSPFQIYEEGSNEADSRGGVWGETKPLLGFHEESYMKPRVKVGFGEGSEGPIPFQEFMRRVK